MCRRNFYLDVYVILLSILPDRQCTSGHSKCADGIQCIPDGMECTGDNECIDYSDESPEICHNSKLLVLLFNEIRQQHSNILIVISLHFTVLKYSLLKKKHLR